MPSLSLFLEKLPLEIRQQVYREVLGGHTIQILPEPHRDRLLGTCSCRAATIASPQWNFRPSECAPIPGKTEQPRESSIALLQTCRQM